MCDSGNGNGKLPMNDLEFHQELEGNGDFMTMNHKKEFCHFQVKSWQFLIIEQGQLAMHAPSVYYLLLWDKSPQNIANTNTYYLTPFLRVGNPGVALLVVLAQGHSWGDQSCSHLQVRLGAGWSAFKMTYSCCPSGLLEIFHFEICLLVTWVHPFCKINIELFIYVCVPFCMSVLL